MRISAIPLLAVIAFVLTACNPSESPSTSAEKQAETRPLPTAIEGTVSVQAGSDITVSPQARLELKLVDISQQPSIPIASKTLEVGSMPTRFSLSFSRDRVIESDLYILEALIIDGERRFTTPLEYPVLTQGAPVNVEVKVAPEPTVAELMLKDYRKLKNSIGGMNISQGTSLGETSSRAWQIFKDDGQIHYVIEIVDYFDAGRTSTDFAYKLGKPWVVVQQHMPSADAPPNVVDRAGWNEAGELVVKQHVSDGEISELSVEEAESLREQAEVAFKRAKS